MKNILGAYADELAELDDKIKSLQQSSMDILEKHVNEVYVGRIIKTHDLYYMIKSIRSVKPAEMSNKRRYMVNIVADIYSQPTDLFGLLILYKDRNTTLFFEADGTHPDHDMPKDFNISDHNVLEDEAQAVLLDHNGDMLYIGNKVHFFENNEVKNGIVAGFDFESKRMKIKILPDNTEYRQIPANCLIKLND